MSDDFLHIKTGQDYEKITHIGGVQTTHCANRFEIIAKPNAPVLEEDAVHALREWVRWRNTQMLSDAGCVPS